MPIPNRHQNTHPHMYSKNKSFSHSHSSWAFCAVFVRKMPFFIIYLRCVSKHFSVSEVFRLFPAFLICFLPLCTEPYLQLRPGMETGADFADFAQIGCVCETLIFGKRGIVCVCVGVAGFHALLIIVTVNIIQWLWAVMGRRMAWVGSRKLFTLESTSKGGRQ